MLTSMDICKRLRHSKGLGRKRTSDWESAIVLAALVAALAGPSRTIAADFMGSAAVSIASPPPSGIPGVYCLQRTDKPDGPTLLP